MSWKRQVVIPCVVGIVLAIGGVFLGIKMSRPKRVSLVLGSVLRQDADPNRQVPLANARIVVANAGVEGECETDSSGFFRLGLHPGVPVGETLVLRVEHSNHRPLTITAPADDRIYVARMVPIVPDDSGPSHGALIPISGVRVRYTEKTTTTLNVGSIVKTFQVVNTGNVPCQRGSPCSPDGKWKAAIGGASFDAGDGNGIKSARVSCIAGPCGFTKIENSNFDDRRRNISVSVRNWSDTVTYLVEAEVVRTVSTDTIRHFYPVIFGRSMDFTLPAASQGLCIEADVNGEAIVFPLGPTLVLSWARCSVETAADHTKLYRCDLQPGYRFQ